MEINIQRIQSYIRENKMSKTAFCKKCNISYHTLQKILDNNFNGNVVILFNIARVLNVSIKDLFA